MIIKKPYAFLIKHFRLIHGLLFVLLMYLMSKTVSIYGFFNDYAVNHTYINQANLASKYVSIFMYIAIALALIVLFIIFFILSLKDKANRLYLASILYYIVLLIFYIYIYTVFVGLESKSLDVESVRFFRDVSLIILLPQIVFIFIILGRTLGFNLRQFEFKRDLEELHIDVSDNEEVELTLGNDTYKIARFFRKLLRLTKYFLIENRLFVITFSSIFILAISIFIYSKISVYQESHGEGENLYASSIEFKIKDSYMINTDLNNQIIKDNKQYILVNLTASNKKSKDYRLDRDTFKLKVNDDLILPSFSYAGKFYDFGTVFEPGDIKAGITKEFFVAFEIDNENVSKDYLFKIKNYSENNGVVSYYEDVIIKPNNLNESNDKGTFKLPNILDFNESILKNTKLKINSFDIKEKFMEPFTYTIGGKEKEGVFSVVPSESNRGTVAILKIKSTLELDKDIYLNNIVHTPADFYQMYGMIKYRYQGNYKTVKLNKIDVDYEVNSNSYLEIPYEAQNASKIDLIILVRGLKYTINLK